MSQDRSVGYVDAMTQIPDDGRSEADQIAYANEDDHRLSADIADDEEISEPTVATHEQVPRLDADPDERGHDNDEEAPTATRPID
jgi:hypothetical protein